MIYELNMRVGCARRDRRFFRVPLKAINATRVIEVMKKAVACARAMKFGRKAACYR